MSQSLQVPSVAPLAKMCSSFGCHATVKIDPECPGSECVLAPDLKSTMRTAGCWEAQATSKWLDMSDVACEYTVEPMSKVAEAFNVSEENNFTVRS